MYERDIYETLFNINSQKGDNKITLWRMYFEIMFQVEWQNDFFVNLANVTHLNRSCSVNLE